MKEKKNALNMLDTYKKEKGDIAIIFESSYTGGGIGIGSAGAGGGGGSSTS